MPQLIDMPLNHDQTSLRAEQSSNSQSVLTSTSVSMVGPPESTLLDQHRYC